MKQTLIGSLVCGFLATTVLGQSLQDDFSKYPVGSDASPAWEAQDIGWETVAGGYLGEAGQSLWRAAAFGSAVTFACDLTVLEQLKGEYLTAGIGLCSGDRDYWAMNLGVTPEKLGRKHFTELHESLAGHWLAEHAKESRLESLPGKGGQCDWLLNRPYRIELSLTAESISGRILDGTNEVARAGFRFSAATPAVRAGRPCLRVNGLRVRFSNASVTVQQTVPEPVVKTAEIPAWQSRQGKSVVKGTGFFRVVELEGRWWMVDPEGKLFFAVGTDHVNYQCHWCEKLGYAPYHRNVEAKFGSESAWTESALERLKNWGFNTLPAGHSPSLRHRGLAHILFASFGSGFARHEWIAEPINWTGFPDVFSPRWERHCRIVARRMAAESRGDPWCIGTFLDNELEWYGKKNCLVDEVFQGNPKQAAKKALYDWLLKRFANLDEMNRQLGTHYSDETAFLSATTLPPASEVLNQVRDGFLTLIAERYFSVPARALRELDPDHMVLGCRFAGRVPVPVLESAGRFNDIFTFNTYPRVEFNETGGSDVGGTVLKVPRELTEFYRVVRRPMIITEWSFPALDSGLPCKHGAGMRVDTQEQKAACYRVFANTMADLPFMIGYHYFMWADEPALGISSTFPEDSNYGLVNEKDETYECLVKTATAVNRVVHERHQRSVASGDLELHAIKSGVEVTNPGPTVAQGWLSLNAAGKNRLESITLKPGASRRFELSSRSSWLAQLRFWDGSKTNLIGGKPLGPLEVVNGSSQTLTNVPVILDGAAVVAGVIPALRSGQSVTLKSPETPPASVERLELKSEAATWICDRHDGALFNRIEVGNPLLPLGQLVFALHQQLNGQNLWTSTDRVVSLQLQEQPEAWWVDAVVEFVGKAAPAASGPPRFRAGVRAVVFKRDGVAAVRPLWVENLDSRSWRIEELFWFCRPSIGGSSEDDVAGGANVPDYYRPAQFWTDTKLGGAFGAVSGSDQWRVMFWKSPAGFHPDCCRKVEKDLQPGEHWVTDRTPYLWVGGARELKGWREIEDRCRQSCWLVTGGQ